MEFHLGLCRSSVTPTGRILRPGLSVVGGCVEKYGKKYQGSGCSCVVGGRALYSPYRSQRVD
jgi:hypothetical protein